MRCVTTLACLQSGAASRVDGRTRAVSQIYRCVECVIGGGAHCSGIYIIVVVACGLGCLKGETVVDRSGYRRYLLVAAIGKILYASTRFDCVQTVALCDSVFRSVRAVFITLKNLKFVLFVRLSILTFIHPSRCGP